MPHEETFPINARPANNPVQFFNREQNEDQNRIEDDDEQENVINRAENREQEQQGNQITAANDRVEITAAAREQNRAEQPARGEEADPTTPEEDVETPPVRDQQGAERGARQRVENLEDENARGVNGPEGATAGAQSVISRPSNSPVNNPPGTPNEDIRGLSDTAEATDGPRAAEFENPVREEVRESRRVGPSRDFFASPQESIEANQERRVEAEEASQPLFDRAAELLEPPDEPAGVEQIAQADQDRLTGAAQEEQGEEENLLQQEPVTSPAAIQTEVGQNVNRLI